MPHTAIRFAIVCAFIAATAFPRLALADEPYEGSFKEGRKAMEAHDYPRACQLFKESLQLGAPVGALLNLADCEDKRGHVALSLSLWRDGLAKLPADDPRRDLATRSIDDVGRRVGRIVVLWPNAPPDARAFVDAKSVVFGGEPEVVDPGAHKITITAQGGGRAIDTTVAAGELRTVDAAPQPSTPPTTPPSTPPTGPVEPPSSGPNGLVIGGAVALGIGGAAVIATAVTGGLYLDAKSTVDSECPNRACKSIAGYDAGQSGKTLGAVNVAMWVTSGVGVGLGAIMVGIGASKKKTASSNAPHAEVVLEGTGLSLRGSF